MRGAVEGCGGDPPAVAAVDRIRDARLVAEGRGTVSAARRAPEACGHVGRGRDDCLAVRRKRRAPHIGLMLERRPGQQSCRTVPDARHAIERGGQDVPAVAAERRHIDIDHVPMFEGNADRVLRGDVPDPRRAVFARRLILRAARWGGKTAPQVSQFRDGFTLQLIVRASRRAAALRDSGYEVR